jgi:hypothetical protein
MQLADDFGKLESQAIEDSMKEYDQILDEQILKGEIKLSEAEAKDSNGNGNDGLWDEQTGDVEKQMMQKVLEASHNEADADMIQKVLAESKNEYYAYSNNDGFGSEG